MPQSAAPIISNTLVFQSVKEPCKYDSGVVYVATFEADCNRNKLTDVDIVLDGSLKNISGYNETVSQTLQHDISGNLVWA